MLILSRQPLTWELRNIVFGSQELFSHRKKKKKERKKIYQNAMNFLWLTFCLIFFFFFFASNFITAVFSFLSFFAVFLWALVWFFTFTSLLSCHWIILLSSWTCPHSTNNSFGTWGEKKVPKNRSFQLRFYFLICKCEVCAGWCRMAWVFWTGGSTQVLCSMWDPRETASLQHQSDQSCVSRVSIV